MADAKRLDPALMHRLGAMLHDMTAGERINVGAGDREALAAALEVLESPNESTDLDDPFGGTPDAAEALREYEKLARIDAQLHIASMRVVKVATDYDFGQRTQLGEAIGDLERILETRVLGPGDIEKLATLTPFTQIQPITMMDIGQQVDVEEGDVVIHRCPECRAQVFVLWADQMTQVVIQQVCHHALVNTEFMVLDKDTMQGLEDEIVPKLRAAVEKQAESLVAYQDATGTVHAGEIKTKDRPFALLPRHRETLVRLHGSGRLDLAEQAALTNVLTPSITEFVEDDGVREKLARELGVETEEREIEMPEVTLPSPGFVGPVTAGPPSERFRIATTDPVEPGVQWEHVLRAAGPEGSVEVKLGPLDTRDEIHKDSYDALEHLYLQQYGCTPQAVAGSTLPVVESHE